ncbi:MAG: hypothetical protein J3Q66DRAFT_385364 [Benniella sp.]|nr:MAG: hypothetical protein J3Q66DRAFT_385364 [Benniella sp.]
MPARVQAVLKAKGGQTSHFFTYGTSGTSSSSSSSRVQSSAKDDKDEIGKVFKTVTLTMGALTSCIRRATSLSKEESERVAGSPSLVDPPQPEETRSLGLAESDPHNPAEVLDPHETSQPVEKGLSEFVPLNPVEALDPQETPQSAKQDSFKFDPLDLILEPTDGTTVVRNLLSIVLKGDVKGGKPTTSPGVIAARETAKEIYKEFCKVLEDFEPVNPQAIPLGSPLMELAVNVYSAIRAHFCRLPGLILNKMKKIGISPDPKIQTPGAEDDDLDEEASFRYKFTAGHIIIWWKHFKSLPPEVRPVFIPTTGFCDTFTLFSELCLIPILWGDQRSMSSYPTGSSLGMKVCTRAEADALEKSDYGELLHRLFVSNRETIKRDPRKHQTSYGRQTTTMKHITREAPSIYGGAALKAYRRNLSAFYTARNNALACGNVCAISPPALPQGNVQGRYALSNFLRTNGLQVQLLAFDITKPRRSQKASIGIQGLERRFPDRQSIINTFGFNYHDCAVIEVDPGEVVAASFCGLDPRKPKQVINLHVKRAALYSPTLAHRRAMERLKRQRPSVNAQGSITPAVWTTAQVDAISAKLPRSVELPSIQELESSLPSSTFDTIETYRLGLKQFTMFYSSRTMKKLSWEKTKSLRAEKDWAVNGALQVVKASSESDMESQRNALIVYGNGNFNTRTKLASLHESFIGYFYMKTNTLRPRSVPHALLWVVISGWRSQRPVHVFAWNLDAEDD